MPLWLAAAVLAAAGASAVLRPRDSPPAPQSPEVPPAATVSGDTDPLTRPVEAAFDAARVGDLDRYLEQFADPLRAALACTRAEQGDPGLRDYLKRLTGPMKGLAVRIWEKHETGDAARCPVEFIYQDRNELQTYHFRRVGKEWRISQIDALRSTPTLIPYGTPVGQVR